MKVLHVPYCFRPDPVGGTEVYVEALSQQQLSFGMTPVIAAPAPQASCYSIGGLTVRRFPTSALQLTLAELYGEGDTVAAEAFSRILDDEAPDIVHLHAFTSAVSLHLVREAKRRHLPVVFSYHTPTVSCQRGTLLRGGTDVCDGVLDRYECAACTLNGLGLSKRLAAVVAALPQPLSKSITSMGLSGGAWTALRMGQLIGLRHATFKSLVAEVDHVVALCDWVRELLVRNGIPTSKISVSRHGIGTTTRDLKSADGLPQRTAGDLLRVAFLGRFDPTKGAHVLIEAIRSAPALRLGLDLYGMVQGPGAVAYEASLRALANNEARIRFHSPITAEEVISCLSRYDVVAVPSLGLETGPMVVLEAFAAGTPVVGSKLGGIAELVADGVNGVLVGSQHPMKWRDVLETLSENPHILARLKSGVRTPRSIANVTNEMSVIYKVLLAQPGSSVAIAMSSPDEWPPA